jgi:3-phenylpropionate/trans-cinnamate dioxygenase ferredoxin reductase subunit
MSTDAGMVIVGAGEAGARAAMALRENGYAGSVTLIGEERHLPYERPPLSKAAMTAAEEPAAALILSEAQLAEHGIRHLSGVTVTEIDRAGQAVLLDDGSHLAYAKLLLATGARPRKLTIPGAGPENVLYLRNFSDALALRARLQRGIRLVVIGGGFIGLEIAASALERGCAVTVVEMAPRILGRAVPADVAVHVAAAHEAAGIRLIVGIGLAAIERQGAEEVVLLADGTPPRLRCDHRGHRRRAGDGAGRARRAHGRERHPRRRPAGDGRPRDLRRRRLLRLPAPGLRWPAPAAGGLAQCAGPGDACRPQHAGRDGGLRHGSVVLV